MSNSTDGARYLVVVKHRGRNPVLVHAQDLGAALDAAESLRERFGSENVEILDLQDIAGSNPSAAG